MKLNLNKKLQDLDGLDIEDKMLGKVVAIALVTQTEGDPVKFFDWGMSLHKGEDINLDKADQKTFREFIANSQKLTVLVKGQVLRIVDDLK